MDSSEVEESADERTLHEMSDALPEVLSEDDGDKPLLAEEEKPENKKGLAGEGDKIEEMEFEADSQSMEAEGSEEEDPIPKPKKNVNEAKPLKKAKEDDKLKKAKAEDEKPKKAKDDSKSTTEKPKAQRVYKPKIDLESGLVGPLDSSVAEQVKADGGRRERKPVQHYTETNTEKKAFVIVSGTGTKLGEIPFILEQINDKKRKPDDLKMLHKMLYDRPGTKHDIKKNIRQFSGFPFKFNSDEYKKKRGKMLKWKMTELKYVCGVIGLKQDKSERMVDEIMEFCLNPTDHGKKPKGSSKRRSSVKKGSQDKSKSGSAMGKGTKRKSINSDDDDGEGDSEEDVPPKKRSRVRDERIRKSSVGKKYTVDDSEEEMEAQEVASSSKGTNKSEDEDESPASSPAEVEEKPKGKKTRGRKTKQNARMETNGKAPRLPKKSSKIAKSKLSKDDSEDDGSAHKSDSDDADSASPEPGPITEKRLRKTVETIVAASDLRKVTMKMILDKVVAAFPGEGLDDQRVLIKSIVKDAVSNSAV